ncbi:hypothetical protein GLOIN_2v1080450 [Rhizophagus clarus]|uniref:Uncharacterized protein n=1 Tax=Rhizophagus clarus TaxID=94130 RepID=A0A8H3R8V8_9GLOM|nr:hypothetical protein GLOIN_2v1080450 [Rhizophagus clarus]
MDALMTLRKEINRLGFTPNEQDSLRKYFTENVEKINVVVSFLPDYVTDDEKRGYLKSLISTLGQPGATGNYVKFFFLVLNTSKVNTGLVHVFIDNSNLYVEGKYTIGALEKIYEWTKMIDKVTKIEKFEKFHYMKHLKIDYGCLLTKLLGEHSIGGSPLLWVPAHCQTISCGAKLKVLDMK